MSEPQKKYSENQIDEENFGKQVLQPIEVIQTEWTSITLSLKSLFENESPGNTADLFW